jgi:flagellar biogenesis protein FliO
MNIAFVLQVIWAFALVALLLVAMTYAARAVQRGRLVGSAGRRLVSTIESTALAQNVTVHVLRVADTYFLVGGGAAGVALLAELPASEVEPYIAAQRAALEHQRVTLLRPFERFARGAGRRMEK